MGHNLPVSVLAVLLVIQLCVELSTTKQFFALIAPNIIHTGNEENIVIQCHECAPNTNLPVKIIVNNFPKEDKNLNQTATTLTASNNYLTTANIKIPYNYLSADRNEKQYVIVRANSPQLFEIEKVILVSPHTGYIFIQTDKTIYTPNQNVNYRIFTTDKNLDPADQQVTVLIQNPNSVIVHKEDKMTSKGLTTLTMKIPELVTIGTWKIIAKFSHSQQKEYTTQFEVQEYVLPTFKVELETEKKFFYYKDEELIVNIKATEFLSLIMTLRPEHSPDPLDITGGRDSGDVVARRQDMTPERVSHGEHSVANTNSQAPRHCVFVLHPILHTGCAADNSDWKLTGIGRNTMIAAAMIIYTPDNMSI